MMDLSNQAAAPVILLRPVVEGPRKVEDLSDQAEYAGRGIGNLPKTWLGGRGRVH